MLTLADLLEALTHHRPAGAELALTEAAIDSRQVIPGSLFIALSGERVNGHDYIGAAFERGALVALVQEDVSGRYPVFTTDDLANGKTAMPQPPFCINVPDTLRALQEAARFWRQKLDLKVTGITGSIGKSTTKELAADVLSQRYNTAKNYGNLNNEIGLPLTLLRLDQGYQHAILEMGFYVSGEISFLCEIARPEIGIVTNVTPVHAERAGSLDVIAAGKTELVQALPAHGYAILNYDDERVRAMAASTNAQVLFYGTRPEAHLQAANIVSLGADGLRLDLRYADETHTLTVPMVGKHSVMTILRATALGLVEGLSWDEISHGLSFGKSQLRMVVVHLKNGATLLDDSYNSSPDSCVAALDLLADLQGEKVAILGDMLELGSYEQAGHERVGQKVASFAARFIAIGRRAKTMVSAAREAGMAESAMHWFEDVPAAIPFIKSNIKVGDTALVKGSLGMGMARIVSALEAEE